MQGPTSSAKLVTVFGGSGFIGRYVVQALAKRGHRIRVAVRRPDLAGHVQPLGMVGQIKPIQANLRYRWSVDRAVRGRRRRRQPGRHSGRGRPADLRRGAGLRAARHRRGGTRRRHLRRRARLRDRRRPALDHRLSPLQGGRRSRRSGKRCRRRSSCGRRSSSGRKITFFNRFAAMARMSPVPAADRRRQHALPAGLCRRRRRGCRPRHRWQRTARRDL